MDRRIKQLTKHDSAWVLGLFLGLAAVFSVTIAAAIIA